MHAFLANLDYPVRIPVIIAFIIEPGVWQTLKRALKSKKLEIQAFNPMYFFYHHRFKTGAYQSNLRIQNMIWP